jgi:hypothetical protein
MQNVAEVKAQGDVMTPAGRKGPIERDTSGDFRIMAFLLEVKGCAYGTHCRPHSEICSGRPT